MLSSSLGSILSLRSRLAVVVASLCRLLIGSLVAAPCWSFRPSFSDDTIYNTSRDIFDLFSMSCVPRKQCNVWAHKHTTIKIWILSLSISTNSWGQFCCTTNSIALNPHPSNKINTQSNYSFCCFALLLVIIISSILLKLVFFHDSSLLVTLN